MSRKDLKTSRKWASSHTLNVGLSVETPKALASNISYPKLKKLPPLDKALNTLSIAVVKDDIFPPIGSEIDNSSKISNLRNRQKEVLDNQLKNMETLVKQRQLDAITISNSTDAFHVPIDVAFISPTIRHIFEASQNRMIFKESNGHITLPASDMALKEILCHLYSQWIKQNLGLSSNCNPVKDNVLEVLELGLYLGLQELVEISCKIVCGNIKCNIIMNIDCRYR